MAKAPIPSVAAAIAYADLDGRKNGWADAPELWGEMSDAMRRDYRKLARAAISELSPPQAQER